MLQESQKCRWNLPEWRKNVVLFAFSNNTLIISVSLLYCRTIHTNYDAVFTCESLKMAVIKNKWLAKRLDGEMYSVVFRYEQGRNDSAETWLVIYKTVYNYVIQEFNNQTYTSKLMMIGL